MKKQSIGQFISVLRKANGFTQKQLAEKLNVSDKAVSRWERDESMPDLTLIPVLAEIFGVTSDEVLKGERIDTEKDGTDIKKKNQKQLDYMLNNLKTKFLIRGLIATGIFVIGILLAIAIGYIANNVIVLLCMVLSFGFIAVLLEIVFIILGFSWIKNDEFDEDKLNNCKKYFVNISRLVFWVIFILLSSFGCFFIFSKILKENGSLTPGDIFGIVFLSIALGLTIDFIARHIILKKQVYYISHYSKKKYKLKTICFIVISAVIGITTLCHDFLILYPVGIEEIGTKYTDFEEFKRTVTTPYDADGDIVCPGEEGFYEFSDPYDYTSFDTLTEEDFVRETVNGEELIMRNHNIARINYYGLDKNSDYSLPAVIITYDELKQFEDGYSIKLNVSFLFVYLTEITLVILIYFKKRANLT